MTPKVAVLHDRRRRLFGPPPIIGLLARLEPCPLNLAFSQRGFEGDFPPPAQQNYVDIVARLEG